MGCIYFETPYICSFIFQVFYAFLLIQFLSFYRFSYFLFFIIKPMYFSIANSI